MFFYSFLHQQVKFMNLNRTYISRSSQNINSLSTSPNANDHASTPSDVSQGNGEIPVSARYQYDTRTGEVEVNLDSTLNTSSPSVNEEKEVLDCVEIVILPDPYGKFGFNVRGGYDQKLPVVVSTCR